MYRYVQSEGHQKGFGSLLVIWILFWCGDLDPFIVEEKDQDDQNVFIFDYLIS